MSQWSTTYVDHALVGNGLRLVEIVIRENLNGEKYAVSWRNSDANKVECSQGIFDNLMHWDIIVMATK